MIQFEYYYIKNASKLYFHEPTSTESINLFAVSTLAEKNGELKYNSNVYVDRILKQVQTYKVDKNNYVVYFPTGASTTQEASILEEVSQKIIKDTLTKEDYSKYIEKTLLSKILTEIKKSIESKKNEDKRRLEVCKANINTYLEKVKNEYTALALLESILYDPSFIEKKEKEVSEEIVKLLSHKDVESAHINGNYLSVRTKDIYLHEPKDNFRFYLGKVDLVMPINTNLSDFRILAVNNPRRGLWGNSGHPHAEPSGRTCWGSLAGNLATAQLQGLFYSVFMMMLSFCKTVNIDDSAGDFIFNYDIVNKDGQIVYFANEFVKYYDYAESFNKDITEDMYVSDKKAEDLTPEEYEEAKINWIDKYLRDEYGKILGYYDDDEDDDNDDDDEDEEF